MSRLTCLVAFVFSGMLSAAGDIPRQKLNFDTDWKFALGDPEGAQATDYDASAWRELDLPHDWSVEANFDADAAAGAPGGYLPSGVGWYRKAFLVPDNIAGRRVFIEFDGIYMNGEVWINGHHLGKRPYGYIGVGYDLTPHLKVGGRNVITVKVDDLKQPSARWYGGTGIYRHVWLTITQPVRVAHHGTYVRTPQVTRQSARVAIDTTVINGEEEEMLVEVDQGIYPPGSDYFVAAGSKEVSIPAGSEMTVAQFLDLKEPMLWSPESPNLYKVRTTLRVGAKVLDVYDTPLGVRTLRFDANDGFFLNGEPVILRGMCNHQDLGPLGTALWDQALERRLRMLKDMGCNALRTSHYPQSPEFMRMADEMGFLVVNETFDEWRRGWNFVDGQLVSSRNDRGKARYGYNQYFTAWSERDLTDHLKRDRNHPCVIMWSIANEVPEAQKFGEIETVKVLRDLVREIDPTRPVTAGINHIHTANETGFLEELDIVGYNGGGGSCFLYEKDHERFPNRIIYASEVPHSLQTRGEYRTHTNYREKQHEIPNLTEEEVFPETDAWYESSYDNAGVRINARDSWHLTKTLPYVLGEFRWTGFDYIGESGGWPRVLGNFGIIDLCNFPKDTYYFYQSQWTDTPMIHILPHWNWPGKEGTVIPVHAYTTGDEAELFLNGESLGVRKFGGENPYHLEWMVPYAPGELRAVARKGGDEIAETAIHTAGPPARFQLEADQVELDPRRRDLAYLTVRIEDADGNFDPKGERWVSLQVRGPARILGVHNGDPLSHHPFKSNTVRTFNGLARVIVASTPGDDVVQPNEKRESGEIIVRASVRGWESRELRLKRVHQGKPESVFKPDNSGPRATDVYDEGVPPVD
ncbi:glycoside hydrolase family 2 TIM barrel-domain containing protein [Haloferula helveola]|uniref:glycoside hydrolase family 2 TIM barrel-domain containing protein n=1 Tax=Haloferula helveola TaxID=490095 RepID=UPI0030D21D4C